MDVKAETKYVRLSSSKAHDLATAIRGKSIAEALAMTQFNERKAAGAIYKTLTSAVANAVHKAETLNEDLSEESLWVKEAYVSQGPSMRRYWPRARGGVRPIRRRMSHIGIVLSDDKRPKKR